MSNSTNSKLSTDSFVDALKLARDPSQLIGAVYDIVGERYSEEESKAFLIHLAISTLGVNRKSDIVLASWGLLKGFEEIRGKRFKAERRELYARQSGYEGAPTSLGKSEGMFYKNIAERNIERCRDREQMRSLFADALNNEYQNGKAILHAPSFQRTPENITEDSLSITNQHEKKVQKDCDSLLSIIDYDADDVPVDSPANETAGQPNGEVEPSGTKATGETNSNTARNTTVNGAKANQTINTHTISRWRLDGVHFLLIILLFLAAVVIAFAIVQYISRSSSNSAPMAASPPVTNPDPMLIIDTSKASVSYKNGIDLYKKQEFLLAAEAFTEAIAEQEGITGADSIEVGYAYCMLGLAELYSGQGDPVLHLNRGLTISKMNDSSLDTAKCYFYLANAYFELNQPNRSIENLANCTNILDSDTLVDKLWITCKSDGRRVSFPAQYYSADRFYHGCEYYKLMTDAYNLYGKIRFMTGRPDLSLYYFNAALEDYDLWMTNVFFLSVQYGDTDNPEITEYLDSVNISKITDDHIDIKIYQFADDRITIMDAYDIVSLSRNTDVATFLTNRAMCELSCGMTDFALSDCESALSIFSDFNATERSNISYTYIYYALAKMSYWSDDNDLTSLSEAQQNEIFNYIIMAVNYDREMNKDMPYRLAFSLETLGNTYLLFGKNEDSVAAYSEAYQIYLDLNYSAFAKSIKSELRKIFESEGKQTISFDEWLDANLS